MKMITHSSMRIFLHTNHLHIGLYLQLCSEKQYALGWVRTQGGQVQGKDGRGRGRSRGHDKGGGARREGQAERKKGQVRRAG